MRSERFEFPGAHGQRLAGRLDSPDGTPLATAVAATVNAWLHRSGSFAPAVTLITRFLAMSRTLAAQLRSIPWLLSVRRGPDKVAVFAIGPVPSGIGGYGGSSPGRQLSYG